MLLYFSSQQLINASASVMETQAYAAVLLAISAFVFLQASAVIFHVTRQLRHLPPTGPRVPPGRGARGAPGRRDHPAHW